MIQSLSCANPFDFVLNPKRGRERHPRGSVVKEKKKEGREKVPLPGSPVESVDLAGTSTRKRCRARVLLPPSPERMNREEGGRGGKKESGHGVARSTCAGPPGRNNPSKMGEW